MNISIYNIYIYTANVYDIIQYTYVGPKWLIEWKGNPIKRRGQWVLCKYIRHIHLLRTLHVVLALSLWKLYLLHIPKLYLQLADDQRASKQFPYQPPHTAIIWSIPAATNGKLVLIPMEDGRDPFFGLTFLTCDCQEKNWFSIVMLVFGGVELAKNWRDVYDHTVWDVCIQLWTPKSHHCNLRVPS